MWEPILKSDYALVPLGRKQDHFAIVDKDQLELLQAFRTWSTQPGMVYSNERTKTTTTYTRYAFSVLNERTREMLGDVDIAKTQTIRMHRLIMMAPKEMDVDHINGNGLDNRKSNLRVVTHQENQCNQQRHYISKSGFKGVHQQPNGNWCVRIVHDNRRYNGGTYEDPTIAARYYDRLAIHLHGEFAGLNFPNSKEETLKFDLPVRKHARRKDAGIRKSPTSTAADYGSLDGPNAHLSK